LRSRSLRPTGRSISPRSSFRMPSTTVKVMLLHGAILELGAQGKVRRVVLGHCITPLVSLSSRCTMPGRRTPPMPGQVRQVRKAGHLPACRSRCPRRDAPPCRRACRITALSSY
jgi:ribosomal protein L25 (general stress protein Ctc)